MNMAFQLTKYLTWPILWIPFGWINTIILGKPHGTVLYSVQRLWGGHQIKTDSKNLKKAKQCQKLPIFGWSLSGVLNAKTLPRACHGFLDAIDTLVNEWVSKGYCFQISGMLDGWWQTIMEWAGSRPIWRESRKIHHLAKQKLWTSLNVY